MNKAGGMDIVEEKTMDFEESNKALDRLMGVAASVVEASGVTQETLSGSSFEDESDETQARGIGRLIVQVTTAGGTLPIQGAEVTVSRTNGDVVNVQTTDNSGRTRSIELDTPSFIYSRAPGNMRPYSTYNVRTEAPGYFTQNLLNVAVFDRIESIQPISMEPVGEDELENDRIEE